MQSKGSIKLFAILLSITCIYYMVFTWVTTNVEKDAKQFAEESVSKPEVIEAAKKYAIQDVTLQQFYLDSLKNKLTDQYLDSIKKKSVYDIFITQFTYEDCKEKEVNLGLDLRGGMNVVLEISVADVIKALSNYSNDETFNKAIEKAKEMQKKDGREFVKLFGEAFKSINPNAKLAPVFQTIELKGKIDFNSKDEDVLNLIKERIDEAIETSEKTLRARIDKFGVTQPNIQRLQSSGRILVELPGVKDKERVRKLLQGTAKLEFWETYENKDIYPLLNDANKRLKEILSGTETDSTSLAQNDSIKKASGDGDKAAAVSSKQDSLTKDTASASSLAEQLGKKDSSKSSVSSVAGKDTAFANYVKNNPLFAVLRPAIYQDEKQQWMIRKGPAIGYVSISDTAKVSSYLNNKKIRNIFPARMKFLWSFKPFDKEGNVLELVAIKVTSRDGKSPLSGDIITDARKEFEQRGSGSPQISMTMNSEAAQVWKRLTGDNVGKSIAIVLDDRVYSYPNVEGEIAGGRSSIMGNFTVREADDLVNILRAGKMPAPAHIVSETVVGPTLGQEAISAGFLSFVIALIVVLLFMGIYYSKAGWVADLAMLVNVFFVMGILASLGAVLTLPGIAGIVLTIGLSVDANILIFERVREELASGKGVALAVKEGYKNAMSSIIDSQVTTLLLGIILYTFGTGPIQGFATTLIIGIFSSLFCAIFITRIIFDNMLEKNKPISFSIPATANLFKKINIDFVGKRKLYYLFSSAIIIMGIVFYFKNGGFNLGVDFKGGRSYVVRFDEERNTEKVRDILTASFEAAPEVKTYGEKTQQKISTTYLIGDNSADAESNVEIKLKEGLNKLNVKYEIMSSEKVGETISRDIKSKAIWSILFSCLVMFIFIFIRFKRWQYGLGAVAALFHDVLVVLSCYTIFDGILPFSLEIGQDFIAAILTIMGYSMTDTVVVFDRIREYLTEKNKGDLDEGEKQSVINNALNNTLSRTINTSLTIFFVLLSIFIFGGETIRGFSFALLIGIVIGTYSSICIATPIVIDFDRKKKE